MESHRWVKTSLRLAPSAIISSVRLSAVRSDSACIQSSVTAPVLSVLKIPLKPIPCLACRVDAARPSTSGNRAFAVSRRLLNNHGALKVDQTNCVAFLAVDGNESKMRLRFLRVARRYGSAGCRQDGN